MKFQDLFYRERIKIRLLFSGCAFETPSCLYMLFDGGLIIVATIIWK